MSNQLVTISTHLEPMEAAMARNKLDAAGIRAEIADEETAVWFWDHAGAIHGVKLIVAEADAERARQLLAGEEDGEDDAAETAITAEAPEPEEAPPNKREDAADRAFRSALLGLALWPLQLYTAWLVADAWSSEEPLRPAPGRSLAWATGIILPFVLLVLWFMAYCLVGILNAPS